MYASNTGIFSQTGLVEAADYPFLYGKGLAEAALCVCFASAAMSTRALVSCPTNESGRNLVIISGAHLLPDGRRLGIREFGLAGGHPTLFFHGAPGGAIQAELFDCAASEAGIRLIAIDRWGYGDSDPCRNGSAEDFARDVEHLMHAIHIESADIVAVSGGAPGALAMACFRPERVKRLRIVAGMAVVDAASTQHLGWVARSTLALAKRKPKLASRVLRATIMIKPKGFLFRRFVAAQLDADRAILRNPHAIAMLYGAGRDHFLQGGVEGAVRDIIGIYAPLPFELTEIQIPARLIYSAEDKVVPLSVGKQLSKKLPNAQMEVVENRGHIGLCFAPEFVLPTRAAP